MFCDSINSVILIFNIYDALLADKTTFEFLNIAFESATNGTSAVSAHIVTSHIFLRFMIALDIAV